MSASSRIKKALLNVTLFTGLLQGQEPAKPAQRSAPAPAAAAPQPTPEQVDAAVVKAMEMVIKKELPTEASKNFKISPPGKHKDIHAMIAQLHDRAKEVVEALPENPDSIFKFKMTVPEKPPKLVVFDSNYIYATSLPAIGKNDPYIAVSSAFLKQPERKKRAGLAHEYSHIVLASGANIALLKHYNNNLVNNYLDLLSRRNVPEDKQTQQYREILADGFAVLLTCDAKSLADTLNDMSRNATTLWTEKNLKELKRSEKYRTSSREKRHEMENKTKADGVFLRTFTEYDIESDHPGGFMRREMLTPIEPLAACPATPLSTPGSKPPRSR